MMIRDRIKEFRRVKASELLPNPKNWRTHPDRQRDVLKGVLAEIGYADALLARELDDGNLQLVDGHLRAETTPDQEVPVLILDLNQDEAHKLLTIFDPLAGLAGINSELLSELVSQIETENNAVRDLLDEISGINPEDLPNIDQPLKDLDVPELFQILVQCSSEDEQREVFEQLTADGRNCKILNL